MSFLRFIRNFIPILTFGFCVILLSSNHASAASNEKIYWNKSEKERFYEFGFTDDELANMTYDEYKKFKDLSGKLENKVTKYYKVTKLGMIEYDEETAVAEIRKEGKFKTENINVAATADSGWIKLTLTSTKIYDSYGRYTGEVQLKNSFQWLTSPTWKLVDTLAISHSTHVLQIPGTAFAKYLWDDGVGTHSDNLYYPDAQNSSGIAFKIDIRGIGTNAPPTNHRGYMYFNVKKSTPNNNEANAYGHYSHVYFGVSSYSINIYTGNISISGAQQVKEAKDVSILFSL
ncbi:hypothetical protein [Anoxybacteroides amylolyticum]|uniref:Uncharacterized protein n=1 Tax=Anoxybacteroides amylolyticum TaxID=294699 RepID=A0A160F788_9BACL|nr:hypothetical protein [Anoxybacillus amylolyticus]ANB61883.1 hypothetical protein GFC30_326 [Anoxybacillus amylolyticus]